MISSADTDTSIILEYSDNLSGWTAAIDDETNIIITETDDAYGTGIDQVEVKIKRTLSNTGSLFSRLKVNITE